VCVSPVAPGAVTSNSAWVLW